MFLGLRRARAYSYLYIYVSTLQGHITRSLWSGHITKVEFHFVGEIV